MSEAGEVVLQLEDVVKHYRRPRQRLLQPAPVVQALRGVGLCVQRGTSLGIVGESGSGKSTLARVAMGLEAPTSGVVKWSGQDLKTLSARALRRARRDVQMVFQDPYGSLDPRQRIGRSVAEPLAQRGERDASERVAQALEAVGLSAADALKYPHEFSGGQRQRVAIARALITRPKLIVADEPVSALDVSVQAQVLNLMAELQDTLGVTYLFISHDLAVVHHVCDEVAVMYAGRIVEQGTPEVLFGAAAHPYTRALAAELPRAAWDAPPRPAPPGGARSFATVRTDTLAAITGCAYAARCAQRRPRCEVERPELRALGHAHRSACHYAESIMTLPPGAQE